MARKKNSQSSSDYIREYVQRMSPFTPNPRLDQLRVMENHYIRTLTEWCSTRFQWKNLPEEDEPLGISQRHIEMELFYRGMMVFYFDKRYGRYMCVRAVPIAPHNSYGDPTEFETISTVLYESVRLSIENCVPIWASYTREPELAIVQLFAARLAEIDTSIRVVARNMRVNTVIAAKDSQQLTFQNVIRQVNSGVDVIYAKEGIDLSAIQALNLGINPSVLAGLRDEKNQLWNECMTVLGIENANMDKKERLVTDEVNSNNGQIMVARNAAMKVRKEAVSKINNMFDLDVEIDWAPNEIQPTIVDNDSDVDDEKEENNG